MGLCHQASRCKESPFRVSVPRALLSVWLGSRGTTCHICTLCTCSLAGGGAWGGCSWMATVVWNGCSPESSPARHNWFQTLSPSREETLKNGDPLGCGRNSISCILCSGLNRSQQGALLQHQPPPPRPPAPRPPRAEPGRVSTWLMLQSGRLGSGDSYPSSPETLTWRVSICGYMTPPATLTHSFFSHSFIPHTFTEGFSYIPASGEQ